MVRMIIHFTIIHTMVRTKTHFEFQSILKEPVGVVNVMNEITNLHPSQKKQKENNKKRNDLKGILTSVKIFCLIFF